MIKIAGAAKGKMTMNGNQYAIASYVWTGEISGRREATFTMHVGPGQTVPEVLAEFPNPKPDESDAKEQLVFYSGVLFEDT